MGSVIEKKHRDEPVEEEAAKSARRVGRLSMIVRSMRPGAGLVAPVPSGAGMSTSSSAGSPKQRTKSTTSPLLGTLSELDEAAEKGRVPSLDADGAGFVDTEGKLNYDAEVVEESDFEDPCAICNMYKRESVLTCRVCARPFHRHCIMGRGQGTGDNSAKAMDSADTDVGWSCPDCEALSELISMDDMCELMIKFDNYDNDGDSIISLSNYMEYESRRYQQENNDCIPGWKVKKCEEAFREYDRDDDGLVNWWDFSAMEAVKILQKAPQVELLEQLKPREIAKLRKYFKMSDKQNRGLVTVGESELAYRGWLRAMGLSETEETMRSFERSSSTEECSKTITWERFVRNKALALITSRPNTPTIRPYVTSRHETAL